MKKVVYPAIALLVLAGASLLTADDEEDGFKARCPVSGKPARETVSADYREARVYFCCPGCTGTFAGDTAKYAVQANNQLVVTGQYEQKACPRSGSGDLNPEIALEVGGVQVAFCCDGCRDQVATADDDDEQLTMVFGNSSFETTFEKVAAEEE